MDYRYGSHTVFQIEYHFVWVTKYRYKVVLDLKYRVASVSVVHVQLLQPCILELKLTG